MRLVLVVGFIVLARQWIYVCVLVASCDGKVACCQLRWYVKSQ